MNGIKLLGRQGHRSHRASWGAGERHDEKYFQVVVLSAMKDSKVGEEDICAERES